MWRSVHHAWRITTLRHRTHRCAVRLRFCPDGTDSFKTDDTSGDISFAVARGLFESLFAPKVQRSTHLAAFIQRVEAPAIHF